jgi:hypothetical protein
MNDQNSPVTPAAPAVTIKTQNAEALEAWRKYNARAQELDARRAEDGTTALTELKRNEIIAGMLKSGIQFYQIPGILEHRALPKSTPQPRPTPVL